MLLAKRISCMEVEASIASIESVRTDTDLFGHPRGLIVLAGTEFWDRISFHGMQALLVLYMAEQLLLPGHVAHVVGFAAFRSVIEAVTGPLSNQALATQIFGVYVGLVYFTPLLGGVLGDRLLGRFHTVALGAILMSAGHFCMAFDRSFLLALLLLVLGAGCLRGNLMSQVGALYSTADRRRDDGFQIYYALLNGSIFAGSMISGRLGGLYERLSASQFWLLHATIVGSGGLLILLFAPLLKRMLNNRHQVSAGAAAPAHG
jgi:proton-dependent oligopeptide transporter, POT family